MTQRQLSETLKWIIKIGIFSVLFTQFFVYSGFFFPYIFTKTIFFRIVMEIVLFAYLFLISLDPDYKFKSTKISWAIFAYIGIVLLTSIIGINFSRSFWGTVERSEGIITMLHIVALFVVSYSVFKEKKDWLMLFDVAFFAGLIHAGYGLLQKFNVKTFLGFEVLNAGGRVQGAIGNASFFAGILVLTIFIGALLFLHKKNSNWRIFYGLGLLLSSWVLYCSQTRGAILGLLGGVFIFAILSIFFSQNKKLKLGLVSGILIVIISSIIVWNCREQQWVKESGTLNKLTSISLSDVSTEARLLGWQGAIKGWVETPKTFLFGYGYENYNVPFNKYFNPKIFRDAGSQLWFDRAHNIVFDVALTSGLIGLAAYLSIFAVVLWGLYQLYKKDKENLYLYLLLVSGLAAYFAQNLFVFDTLPTYILFYLILAYIAYLFTSNKPSKEKEEIKKKDKIEIGILGSALLIVILYLVAYTINIRPAQANYDINQAFRYAHYGNDANNQFEKITTSFDEIVKAGTKTSTEVTAMQEAWAERARASYNEAVYYFNKAIEYNDYQRREFREKYIESVLSFYKNKCFEGHKDTVDTYLSKILAEADKNVEEYPQDVQEYLYAMTAYNMAYIYGSSRLEHVYLLTTKALELSSARPQIFYEIAKAKIEEKKFDEGIVYFQKAVDLNPEPIESHWNLLIAYIQAGKNDMADAEIQKMQEMKGLSFENSRDLRKLIGVFSGVGNYEKVAWLYDKLIELQSLTPDNYIQAAIVNKEIGEYGKARQYAQKIMELDPSLIPQAQAFLNTLE